MPVARPTGSLPPPPRAASGAHRAASLPPPVPPRSSASMPAMQAPMQGRMALYVIFNGQKIPVAKDEFIIGRGSKSADLAIKDGNISRRHAAVVWHNGAYYLKDLGSTNGVEYQGRRFDTKRIDEGDIFRICDYELRFTYA
jgi:pSer/pThr/pTyr-binding forkhead associated (FHA) protein